MAEAVNAFHENVSTRVQIPSSDVKGKRWVLLIASKCGSGGSEGGHPMN